MTSKLKLSKKKNTHQTSRQSRSIAELIAERERERERAKLASDNKTMQSLSEI